jgi:hypothetical protein
MTKPPQFPRPTMNLTTTTSAMPLPDPRQAADPAPAAGMTVGTLVRSTVVALLATGAGLVAVLALVNRPDWWRGLLAASLVSALSAAASIPPLAWGLRRRLDQRVVLVFVAMAARAVVSLGGCVLAVTAGGYPAAPTLLLMVVFYFALLAVETTIAARAVLAADRSAGAGTGGPDTKSQS